MANIRIEHGDSREVLKTLADDSIDSCVTDPPYALVSIVNRFGKTNLGDYPMLIRLSHTGARC